MLDGVKNFFASKYDPKDKDFEKYGYITPEHFTKAGDLLSNSYGWKWEKAISTQKRHSQLPDPNKQYLWVYGRSEHRIKDIMKSELEVKEGKDGFIEPIFNEQKQSIVDCRQYTISITYDSYYHVPRLWLTGHDEQGKPLNPKQIFEDITSEHENETVTLETHPHLNEKQVTIHPCKHSERIKSFIQEAKERGTQITPEQSLILFLQFMPSIMPTMELDCYGDISLGN